jgi:hypothetical protein
VIKADALPTWHQKWVDQEPSIKDAFAGLLSIRNADTIMDWADLLKRQHRPGNPLLLPEFMAPKAAAPVRAEEPRPAYERAPAPAPKTEPDANKMAPVPSLSAAPDESLKKKLICVTCGTKISYPEGKFCWNNEKRFGGFQYCREHQ